MSTETIIELGKKIDRLQSENIALKLKNEKCIETLKFYANRENYKLEHYG